MGILSSVTDPSIIIESKDKAVFVCEAGMPVKQATVQHHSVAALASPIQVHSCIHSMLTPSAPHTHIQYTIVLDKGK